jgi:hypothetical protein
MDRLAQGIGAAVAEEQEDLIHYVMDLEELVKWLALPFEYEDPISGEAVGNTPIWPRAGVDGEPLPAAIRLTQTWAKVFGEDE